MRTISLFILFALSLASCQKNAVTGRQQLLLVDEGELQKLSLQQYHEFLSKNKIVPAGSTKDQERVSRVGQRLATAIAGYYAQQGKADVVKGYKWEFNLVESKEMNAWCMPGGKVVVYTGLLPLAASDASLAVVMGHEIAHALAQHGNERMSQAMMQQLGGEALSVVMISKPALTRDIFLNAYGVGSTLGGTMPFGRKQELEADRYGLIMAALAGYDPHEAIAFWQAMAKAEQGQQPPEWLSTHPSDATRIEKVKEYANEASKYYKPVNQSFKKD
jgi:predicted Zn-dependent protease